MTPACPFCLGAAEVVTIAPFSDDGTPGQELRAVECQDCGAIGPAMPSADDAVASWQAVAEAAAAGRSVDATRQARIQARRLAGFDLPDVVSVQQAADWLGVHPSTIRRALRRGELPANKVGRVWVFSRHRLIDFADGHVDGWTWFD